MQRFWNEHAEWSQATFGTDTERGPLGALRLLEKEAREAQADITDRVEYADCLFLILDAARSSGMSLDDLLDVAFEKLATNKKRTWAVPKFEDMPIKHVRKEKNL
jgi:hypothetical protein